MSNNKNMRGFTLIEMSISMIIIALLTLPFFQIYSNYQTTQEIEKTDNNVQRVAGFVQEFYTQNGFYPCPASMNMPRANALYGHSVDCSVGAATYDPISLPAGNCTAGICMEEAVDVRKPALPLVLGTEHNVIVGAIPYRDLQLDEDDAVDGYGGRLLYAVTYSMTDRTTFDYTKGAVSILDEAGETRVTPEGSADFVVISHGATGEGSYSREGVLVASCAGGAKDSQNCNIGFEGAPTVDNDAIYISGLRSNASGADFYDDVVEYFNRDVLSPWRRTDTDKENIEALASNDVQVGDVAVVSAKLHVATSGNLGTTAVPALRVSGTNGADGTIYTASICDVNGNCFTPENLAADNQFNPGDGSRGDGMKCPAGQYMVGIANGVAVCQNTVEVRCKDPSLPVLRSINANGTLNCVAVPNPTCLADPAFVQCPGHATKPTVSLPQRADGQRTGWKYAGDCRREKYLCNAGTWVVASGTSGNKVCNDSTAGTTTHSCTARQGYSGGTYTNTAATVCEDASSTFTADCFCDNNLPANRRQINCPPCGAGQSLSTIRPQQNQRRYCKPGGHNGFWGNVDANYWINANAAWMYAGGVSNCPPTSTYCSCTNGPYPDEWRSASCPPRQKNGASPRERKYVWNATTCKFDATSDYRGDCVCDTPPATSDWRAVSCSDPNKKPAPTPKEREYVWNDTVPACKFEETNNYRGDECVCKTDLITEVRTISTCNVPCEAPVDGFIKYHRNPATCLKDLGNIHSEEAAICNPLTYSWKDFSSSTYSGDPLTRKVGDSCSCELQRTEVKNCDLSGIAKKCHCIP